MYINKIQNKYTNAYTMRLTCIYIYNVIHFIDREDLAVFSFHIFIHGDDSIVLIKYPRSKLGLTSIFKLKLCLQIDMCSPAKGGESQIL